METFVLRWTKDNLPFWQGIDSGEKIEINAVADVINENAVLKRELKYWKDAHSVLSEVKSTKEFAADMQEAAAGYPHEDH